jgi:molybdopterin converting factor small subunit
MARVVLPRSIGDQYAGGETELEIAGATVRDIVRALDVRFPGLGQMIDEAMAVAVDGEILQDPYLEAVKPDSELFVLPKIGGGV